VRTIALHSNKKSIEIPASQRDLVDSPVAAAP
jgi:hypothetical protein